MNDAVAALQRGVVDGTPRHRNDPVVTAHIAAAVVKDTPGGPHPEPSVN